MQKPWCTKLSNSKQILLCSYFQKSVMFLNNMYYCKARFQFKWHVRTCVCEKKNTADL